MRILIEPLSAASKECGIIEQSIRNAVMFPLSSTKIDVLQGSGRFYVNATTVVSRSYPICISSLKVEVSYLQSVMLGFSNKDTPDFVAIKLWESGTLFSSGQHEHTQRMSENVEELTKKFITDWNLDNKSSAK